MKLPSPANILRKRKEESNQRVEMLLLFSDRLRDAFKKQNKASQAIFIERLKEARISAPDMRRLAEECVKDTGVVIKWERKVGQENNAKTLAEVKAKSTFSKVLIILRELYAQDIAADISFDDAAQAAIKEVFLHP